MHDIRYILLCTQVDVSAPITFFYFVSFRFAFRYVSFRFALNSFSTNVSDLMLYAGGGGLSHTNHRLVFFYSENESTN